MVELKCAQCGKKWAWDGKPIHTIAIDSAGRILLHLGTYEPAPTKRRVATCPRCRFLPKQTEASGTNTNNALAFRQRVKKSRTDS